MYYHDALITPWGLPRAPGLHPVVDSMKNKKGDRAGKGKQKPAATASAAKPARRFSAARLFLVAMIVSATAVALAYFLLGANLMASRQGAPPSPLAFVGSETCASCHQKQAEAWRGSHHRHAMAHAARFAAQPPKALRLTKRLMKQAQRMELKDFLDLCAVFQGMCHNEPEHIEAVRRFLERQK